MTENEKDKEIKVEFAPGCFDHFDGTQEELDELIAEIKRMAQSGELRDNARQIDFDDLSEEDMEAIEHLMMIEEEQGKRNLQ